MSFNAEKGDTGDKGDDFNNQFNFINCLDNNNNNNNIQSDEDYKINRGLIYKNSEYDGNKTTNIQLRTLKSGTICYNDGQMNLDTLSISTEKDSILIKSLPQPYNWDISQLSIEL